MGRSVKPKKRAYKSRLRTEQALDTRKRVLDAAHRLFVDRGYARTTIAAVAARASVSPETIYVTFGTKRALLEGVIDQTIIGPATPMPLSQQIAAQEIEKLARPADRLRTYVAFVCKVLARTASVHAVIRGAADAEESFIMLRKRLLAERRSNNKEPLRKYVGKDLRTGLTFERALDSFVALSSPEVYYLLTVDMGWTAKQHQEWLFNTALRELVNP